MKTKAEQILENKQQTSYSDVCSRRESFCIRWNLIDDNKDNNVTKTRCLNVLCKIINAANRPSDFSISFDSNVFLNEYCSELSMILGFDSKSNSFDTFESKDLYKKVVKLDLNVSNDYHLFIWFLEETLNYNFEYHINKDILVNKLNEALTLSNAKIKILKNGDVYELYPTNIEMLDEHLIFDNINWLDKYPKAKEHFSKAVKLDIIEENFRTIVDELRLSLELLLKQLFNNEKSLENQKSELGKYLKENNISNEINSMYVKLFDLYTLFNNHNAKHNDDIDMLEINYIIYLTGTFISLLVQIEENKIRVK